MERYLHDSAHALILPFDPDTGIVLAAEGPQAPDSSGGVVGTVFSSARSILFVANFVSKLGTSISCHLAVHAKIGGWYFPLVKFAEVTHASSLPTALFAQVQRGLAQAAPTAGIAVLAPGSGAAAINNLEWDQDIEASWTITGTGDSGTANAAVTSTDTTLTDTREAWTVNQWIGAVVTCNGKTMTVISNTADTLTGAGWSGGGNPGDAQAWTLSPVVNFGVKAYPIL